MTTDPIKLCKDCRHSVETKFSIGQACLNAEVANIGAASARTDQDDCGPSARFFEPKER